MSLEQTADLSLRVIRVPPTGADAITLRQHEDGRVTLEGGWPETAFFAQEVLEQARPELLWVRGDRIHLELANGAAEYLITERDAQQMTVTAARVYARKDEGGG